MFKDNNRNTRAKLTKQTLERRHWRHSTVFISQSVPVLLEGGDKNSRLSRIANLAFTSTVLRSSTTI